MITVIKHTHQVSREDRHGRVREATITEWDVVQDSELLGSFPTKREALASARDLNQAPAPRTTVCRKCGFVQTGQYQMSWCRNVAACARRVDRKAVALRLAAGESPEVAAKSTAQLFQESQAQAEAEDRLKATGLTCREQADQNRRDNDTTGAFARLAELKRLAALRSALALAPDAPVMDMLMQLCAVLRLAGYRPHSQIRVMGEQLELISYPFPLDDLSGVGIMVRTPDDPTTMRPWVVLPTVITAALEVYGPGHPVVCAWCPGFTGDPSGTTSHGICPACARKMAGGL